MKARVMPDGRVSLPADLRKRHGLAQGGEVIVEDTGDAIVLRTLDQVVARAQALSRQLIAGRSGASMIGSLRPSAAPICRAHSRQQLQPGRCHIRNCVGVKTALADPASPAAAAAPSEARKKRRSIISVIGSSPGFKGALLSIPRP